MKEIRWTLDEEKDEGTFYVSEGVDWGDVMVVIMQLANKFNINLKRLHESKGRYDSRD